MSANGLIGKPADDVVEDHIKTEYASVLGAVAYCMLTQLHLLIYIVALQRRSHSPTYLHCRRLNALLRHMQRHPRFLMFAAMTCSKRLVVHSDSGFTKEQERGYGVRAANHLREGVSRSTRKTVYHFLHGECRGHRRVTSSTYSSELQAAIDAVDELLSLAVAMGAHPGAENGIADEV